MKKLSTLLITLLLGFVLPKVAIADTTMLQQFLGADEPEVVTEGAEKKIEEMGYDAEGWQGDKNPQSDPQKGGKGQGWGGSKPKSDPRVKGMGGQGNGWGGNKN